MVEIEVEIYGKKYTLRGSNPEEVRAVAKSVDARMRELFGSEPKPLELSKTIALAINLAEEIYNLKKDASRYEEEIAKILEKISKKINQLEKILELCQNNKKG